MKKILAMLLLSGISTAFISADRTDEKEDEFTAGYEAGIEDGIKAYKNSENSDYY